MPIPGVPWWVKHSRHQDGEIKQPVKPKQENPGKNWSLGAQILSEHFSWLGVKKYLGL